MTTESDRPLVGVGIVVVENDHILLIKRGREPGKGLWAVPGGKVEVGETLRETAQREMLEETGLIVDVGEVIWVGEHIEDDRHIVLIDFEATVTGGELRAADDADQAMWVRVDVAGELPLTPTMYNLLETIAQ